MYDLTLINAHIITPFATIREGFLTVKDGLINFVGDHEKDAGELSFFSHNSRCVYDLAGKKSVPGFIDIHTHGALGGDYSNHPDLLFADAKFKASKGVTGFLPTIGALVSPEAVLQSAGRLVELSESKQAGARPVGINLEGPFLHPDWAGGAGPDNCLRFVDIEFLRRALDVMGSMFKVITISPELENALPAISFLRCNGVVVSLGHTGADFSCLDKAVRRGAGLVTHIFDTAPRPKLENGLITPGIDEYLMLRDEVMVEAICDIKGIHIKPLILQMLLRCKGIDKTIIITDSLITPGTDERAVHRKPDGQEMLVRDGVNIIVRETGKHCVAGIRGQIAGSAMTMDLAVKSMINHTGVSLPEALRMAAVNPARLLGLFDRKGSLEVGKDADITVVDDDLQVSMTVVEGEIAYIGNGVKKLF